eukprot:m.93721 g.93721  ORF g.93721 m.93721 type:complete len:742 (-) comp13408_c0_seq1:98-2323(-)
MTTHDSHNYPLPPTPRQQPDQIMYEDIPGAEKVPPKSISSAPEIPSSSRPNRNATSSTSTSYAPSRAPTTVSSLSDGRPRKYESMGSQVSRTTGYNAGTGAIPNIYGEISFLQSYPLPPPYDDQFPPADEEDRQSRTSSRRLTLNSGPILPENVKQKAMSGARILRYLDSFQPQDGPVIAGVYIPLPEEWQEASDANGRPYFIDHGTRCTQLADPRPLPEFWEVKFSSNGWPYYVDHLAKKSYWKHPCSTPLPPGWQQIYDANGRLYYVDRRNQRTQWDKPISQVPQPMIQAMPPQPPTPRPMQATAPPIIEQQPQPNTIPTEAEPTDVLISHAWAEPQAKKSKGSEEFDALVEAINEVLIKQGLKTWCKKDKNISSDEYTDAIDNTQAIVMIVTKKYLDDVRAKERDTLVKSMFTYAKQTRPSFCIPAVLEKQMKNLNHPWHGPVLAFFLERHKEVVYVSGKGSGGINPLYSAIVDLLPPKRKQSLNLLPRTSTVADDNVSVISEQPQLEITNINPKKSVLYQLEKAGAIDKGVSKQPQQQQQEDPYLALCSEDANPEIVRVRTMTGESIDSNKKRSMYGESQPAPVVAPTRQSYETPEGIEAPAPANATQDEPYGSAAKRTLYGVSSTPGPNISTYRDLEGGPDSIYPEHLIQRQQGVPHTESAQSTYGRPTHADSAQSSYGQVSRIESTQSAYGQATPASQTHSEQPAPTPPVAKPRPIGNRTDSVSVPGIDQRDHWA